MKSLWILIGVVVIGGGIYFATAKKSATPAGSDTTITQDDATQTNNDDRYKSEFSENTSLATIASAGGSYECTMTSEVQGTSTTGTVYVANKKMSGEFTTTVPQAGMTVKSYLISDGDYTYSWSNMMPKGIKAKVTETSSGTGAASGSQQFDYNANMNYSCKAWTMDTSKFTVPTTVTFTEVK